MCVIRSCSTTPTNGVRVGDVPLDQTETGQFLI